MCPETRNTLKISLLQGISSPRRVLGRLRPPPHTRRFGDPVYKPAFLCLTSGDLRDLDRTLSIPPSSIRVELRHRLSRRNSRVRSPSRPSTSRSGVRSSPLAPHVFCAAFFAAASLIVRERRCGCSRSNRAATSALSSRLYAQRADIVRGTRTRRRCELTKNERLDSARRTSAHDRFREACRTATTAAP